MDAKNYDVNKNYAEDCMVKKEEILKKYNSSLDGLSDQQASANIQKYGKNEITQSKPKMWYHYFFASLLSAFNIILLGITGVLFFTDVILANKPSYTNIIVIFVLVFVSTMLEFVSEYRSNRAAEKLKELVSANATVIRNGNTIKLPVSQLALGDIVVLSAGDLISADLRVIEENNLFLGQSSLTGESDAIRKLSDTENSSSNDIEDLSSLDTICLMGTNVISGSAKAMVVKVGDFTYFGNVADTLMQGKPKTNFRKNIESISQLFIRFMLIMIPINFALNIWKHDLLTTFTFAVAIAIAITPLLLPVILSSTLSKGAVKMSKKKTIVKKLDSIQSFGAMNILCTDKTGTLTEDKIVLEKYLDIHGNEDLSVLKHAFLNSYFQTGLKGNIDTAVIDRGLKNDLGYLTEEYTKVNEIPFDFTRRRLSVVVKNNAELSLITKGAVEEILNICTFAMHDNKVFKITDEIKKNVLKISEELNEEGMRVVAVCEKTNITEGQKFDVKDESDMTLVGFIGFLDPPKESAGESIKLLNEAGIKVIVLTGDNAAVTKCICKKVGINVNKIVVGSEIEKLPDSGLLHLLRKVHIFAKLSPIQKARIVRLLKENGNVVGYMGDGINDAPSLINSDVGISVDTAVDIAKETADIILLEKDLNVLVAGVKEGRATFTNLMKYIKLAASMNLGEVFSVIIASVFLPFLPITPIQLLVQGLLYDMGQLSLPFDNVDKESLNKPRNLNLKSLRNFMIYMAPVSSIFDMIMFASLWFIFDLRVEQAALFQTIWFSYGIVSNLVGLHILRTTKKPIIESNASKIVYFTSILFSVVAILIPFTILGKYLGLVAMPLEFVGLIILVSLLYCVLAVFAKKRFIKKFEEWI